MKKLELKDICSYLPYGLKCTAMGEWDEGEDYVDESTPKIFTMSGICTDSNGERYVEGMYDNDMHTIYFPDDFTPILRPTSDLTKEITHKGETFVPMVKIAKILYGCDFNYEFGISESGIGVNIYDGETYLNSTVFWIDKCSISVFDLLFEWHFDTRNLIDKGEAIDVNTLPNNPYSV